MTWSDWSFDTADPMAVTRISKVRNSTSFGFQERYSASHTRQFASDRPVPVSSAGRLAKWHPIVRRARLYHPVSALAARSRSQTAIASSLTWQDISSSIIRTPMPGSGLRGTPFNRRKVKVATKACACCHRQRHAPWRCYRHGPPQPECLWATGGTGALPGDPQPETPDLRRDREG